jgi:hypothetical protein
MSGFPSLMFLNPPVLMVVIAICIFVTLKLMVLVDFERNSRATGESLPVTNMGRVYWFVAWPGLNATHFFSRRPAHARPAGLCEWALAFCKLFLGATLYAVVAPSVKGDHQLLAGWIAMTGIVFMLHFGGFHVLALIWQGLGRDVHPIMRAPVCATSVGEFWSQRWNLAFRDFSSQFLMRPLSRRFGSQGAAWSVFLFSGIVHDLAISVPAGAGFGLPTAYFVLQAFAAWFERSGTGRGLGLRSGIRGRVFTFLVILPAAYLLFHPPFVLDVILPLIP